MLKFGSSRESRSENDLDRPQVYATFETHYPWEVVPKNHFCGFFFFDYVSYKEEPLLAGEGELFKTKVGSGKQAVPGAGEGSETRTAREQQKMTSVKIFML